MTGGRITLRDTGLWPPIGMFLSRMARDRSQRRGQPPHPQLRSRARRPTSRALGHVLQFSHVQLGDKTNLTPLSAPTASSAPPLLRSQQLAQQLRPATSQSVPTGKDRGASPDLRAAPTGNSATSRHTAAQGGGHLQTADPQTRVQADSTKQLCKATWTPGRYQWI